MQDRRSQSIGYTRPSVGTGKPSSRVRWQDDSVWRLRSRSSCPQSLLRRLTLLFCLVGAITIPASRQQVSMPSDDKLRQDIDSVLTNWLDVRHGPTGCGFRSMNGGEPSGGSARQVSREQEGDKQQSNIHDLNDRSSNRFHPGSTVQPSQIELVGKVIH
jgi:hypothetical protein